MLFFENIQILFFAIHKNHSAFFAFNDQTIGIFLLLRNEKNISFFVHLLPVEWTTHNRPQPKIQIWWWAFSQCLHTIRHRRRALGETIKNWLAVHIIYRNPIDFCWAKLLNRTGPKTSSSPNLRSQQIRSTLFKSPTVRVRVLFNVPGYVVLLIPFRK